MTSINKPKLISLFSGCGGFDLGFQLEGYRTVYAIDFDKPACDTFRNWFGNVVHHKDITKICPFTDSTIPECDVIIGGFPCQDFSVIWKQPGLDGKRGGMYRYFVEFVIAKTPKAFVAENVKGLLSANNGMAIATIINDFQAIEPRYVLKPQVYNFAEYGVPQLRERLLIVGIREDVANKFDFQHPLPTHGTDNNLDPYVTAGEALAGVGTVKANNELANCNARTVARLKLIPEGGNYTAIPKDSPLYVKGRFSLVYRRLHSAEPSRTIIAAGGGGTLGYHYSEPRPLTNRERARLQSFPDSFVFSGNMAEVRKQIGNAVPPQGVRALARQLLPALY